MQRDLDLVREILQQVEAHDPTTPPLQAVGARDAYHVSIMVDARLLDATVRRGIHGEPLDATIFGMTWGGHDFLDAARDDTLWKAAKEKFIKPGISWTVSVVLEWLKMQVHQRVFGVPPSS